jgi:hypothetical protein
MKPDGYICCHLQDTQDMGIEQLRIYTHEIEWSEILLRHLALAAYDYIRLCVPVYE